MPTNNPINISLEVCAFISKRDEATIPDNKISKAGQYGL